MTQIIFYSSAPLRVENTLFTLIEKSVEKGYKSLLLFLDKENCSAIDEKLWTYKQNSFLPHLSCLLYTSPSPRDATLSRMPSSA